MGLGSKIKQYPSLLLGTFKRFPVVIGFLLLQTILDISCESSAFHVFFKGNRDLLKTVLLTYPSWAALLAILLKLYSESGVKVKKPIAVAAHIILLAMAIALAQLASIKFICEEKASNLDVVIPTILIASIFLLSTLKTKNDHSLWSLLGDAIKKFLIAGLVTAVFMALIFVLISCVNALFELGIWRTDILFHIAIVCWVFIAPFLLLSCFPSPHKTDESPFPGRFISAITHFLFIPVQLIYVVILYTYFIKSFVLGDMRCDVFSTTITIALLLSVIFCGIISPARWKTEKKADNVLLKILTISALPLLVIMTITLLRRISHDGMTLARFYILAISLWFYTVYAIVFLKKIQKKIWWAIASFCIVALITAVTPFSLIEHQDRYHHPIYQAEKVLRDNKETKFKTTSEEPVDEIPLPVNSSKNLVQKIGSTCKNNACRETAVRNTLYKINTQSFTLPQGFSKIQFINELFITNDQLKIENDSIFMHVKYGTDSTANFVMNSDVFLYSYQSKERPPLVLESENAALIIKECTLIFYPYVSEKNRVNIYDGLLLTK